jgi:hypothetical protein
MDDDGGLAQAQAELAARASAAEQSQRADHQAVEQALRVQSARVEKAIEAFLHTAEENGVPPERFVVGVRETGPPVGGRLSRWLGLYTQPAPTEQVYKFGYTLSRRDMASAVDWGNQDVVLWRAGIVTVEESRPGTRPHNDHTGILPFHFTPRVGLRPGAVHDGPVALQLETIQGTTEWFVTQLAGYLGSAGRSEA